MDERTRQREIESRFLQQLEQRARTLIRSLPAQGVDVMSMPDGVDGVRARLQRMNADRRELDTLPGTRALDLRFHRSWLDVLRGKRVPRIRGRMLPPIEALVRGDADPGPIGREQVLDALARYEVLPSRQKPSVVVFLSATGFADSAWEMSRHEGPPSVVLIAAREDGGWDVRMPQRLATSTWSRLFEFEDADDRLRRLQYHLEQQADVLESRGLSMQELSELLGTTPRVAESLARRAAKSDPSLMTVVHDGALHLCRSPIIEEGPRMSLWSRIRKLLRLKPTIAERVRELTAQRVKLEQQRHAFDQRIDSLETQEREALAQGAKAKSLAEKKQIAAKLVRARRELQRNRSQAQMFTNQIDVLGTHIHHLTLKEQGKRISLPKAEDLTREAAEAESIMTELEANADLAANIEVNTLSPAMEEEAADILKEFEEFAASESTTEQTPGAAEDQQASESTPDGAPPIPGDPPSQREKSARPELG